MHWTPTRKIAVEALVRNPALIKNPHCPGSPRLSEVVKGAIIAVYSRESRRLRIHILASDWRIADDGFVEVDIQGGYRLFLADTGTIPYLDGNWNNSYVSALMNGKKARKFEAWLRDEGDDRSAKKIRELFPDFFRPERPFVFGCPAVKRWWQHQLQKTTA